MASVTVHNAVELRLCYCVRISEEHVCTLMGFQKVKVSCVGKCVREYYSFKSNELFFPFVSQSLCMWLELEEDISKGTTGVPEPGNRRKTAPLHWLLLILHVTTLLCSPKLILHLF